jgi:hypothetical protein
MPAMATAPVAPRPPAILRARVLAKTAMAAMALVVIAVPSAMAKVAAMPAARRPWAREKTSTISAPAQGRIPAAKATPAMSRQRVRRSSASGGGMWT